MIRGRVIYVAKSYHLGAFLSNLSGAVMLERVMGTNIELFNYELPADRIAQQPADPRDHSRLMLVDKATGKTAHRRFFELADELQAGDVMVFNSSKVFRARLVHEGVEVFVLRIQEGVCEVLVRPGKRFPVGSTIALWGKVFTVTAKAADGVVTIRTDLTAADMLAFCDAHGQIPTPPYVEQGMNADAYQTVYAKQVGSVAAPTAGLHFTPELLERIRAKGVQIEEVTLHVGLGTFRPVQVATLEEHEMHSEWVSITEDTAGRIRAAKAQGRRVIAVGTTTIRVLEGVAAVQGELKAFEGEVNIFITPGWKFRVIDACITNFHLPKSTLLVLIAAFAGREHVLAAYEEAKREGYRFYSFGDAMFVR